MTHNLVGVWIAAGGSSGERWEFRADGTGHAHFDGVMFGAHDWDFRWRAAGPSRVQLDPVGGKTWIIDWELAHSGGDVVLRTCGQAGFWPSGAALRRAGGA